MKDERESASSLEGGLIALMCVGLNAVEKALSKRPDAGTPGHYEKKTRDVEPASEVEPSKHN